MRSASRTSTPCSRYAIQTWCSSHVTWGWRPAGLLEYVPLSVMDVERLIQTVNAVGVRSECPSCGNEEWAPLDTTVALPASGSPPAHNSPGAECLALACKRCGFVRLHSAQVLEEAPRGRSET